jgi:hypothetical protein
LSTVSTPPQAGIKGNAGVKYADAIDGTGPQILSSGAVRSGTSGFELPAQAVGISYGAASGAKYANPGGLVVAGRDNYQGQAFKDVSAAGGTVLIYLDAVIDICTAATHDLLINPSEMWSGDVPLAGQLPCELAGLLTTSGWGRCCRASSSTSLEKMVAENPHMVGWFAGESGDSSEARVLAAKGLRTDVGTVRRYSLPPAVRAVYGIGASPAEGVEPGGAAVVLRGRESRQHGEGRERVCAVEGLRMPGGRG